jgi:NAD(P)-dependent dehydrogenase (short-subunit alcohol dehydrogenase family)
MPSLSVIRSSLAELPSGPPIVAVVAGGTTGIGSYIASGLAKAYAKQGSNLRVYIVGRNATRAESVLAEGRKISPGSDWRFVQATDLALISEVDKACAEIIKRETESSFHGGSPRVDLLYMTHCYPILKERTSKQLMPPWFLIFGTDIYSIATKEGLDAFLSTTYYSRIRFILQLIPLLTASPKPGHVISVYAGGFEDGTKPGELPIGCPPDAEYGVGGVRKYTGFMKTFVFEQLAEKYAGKLSLTHIYPGLVDGPTFYSPDMPAWFRFVWRLMKPLASLYMTSADDCGAVMASLATDRYPAKGQQVSVADPARSSDDMAGGGSYALGQRGDAQKGVMYAKVRKEDTAKLCWDHTMEVLARIEKETAQQS